MELIDSHTHLDFPDFDADRQALLAASRALGVRRMVVLGVYQRNWQRLWELVQSDADLHAAFGLHPVYLDEHSPADLRELGDWLTRLAGHPQLCAVGEFGLDYFLEQLDRQRQQQLFEAQLQLAADFQLPALLHVRRSHAAVIATLKHFKLKRAGIIHAFAGSREEAREYLKLGFRLGLGAPRLAPGPAPAQGHRRLAAGRGGAGNRLAGHGARHVPQPAQQPATPAGDLCGPGRDHGRQPRTAGGGQYRQRLRAVRLAPQRLNQTLNALINCFNCTTCADSWRLAFSVWYAPSAVRSPARLISTMF